MSANSLLTTSSYSLCLDSRANIISIRLNGKDFVPRVNCTYYEVKEQGIEWEKENEESSSVTYKPVEIPEARAEAIMGIEKLPQVPKEWRLNISAKKEEIAFTPEFGIKDDNYAVSIEEKINKSEKTDNSNLDISMTFSVPGSAVFHLADHSTIGHKIDNEMPLEHVYTSGLTYNLIIIELEGMCLRLRTEDENFGRCKAGIRKHVDTFSVTFSWKASSTALLGVFDSYDEAYEDYLSWLENSKKMRKLKERSDFPLWAHGIDLVIFNDMMASNRKIICDFNDIINIAKELTAHTVPENTMFYLAGWAGAFDGCQPEYIPAPELGGKEGFIKMISALHDMGYKLMIHTTVWGIDPYAGDIEKWEEMSVKRDGKITGWQVYRERADRMVPFHYHSPKIPLNDFSGKKNFTVPIGYLPGDCYAYFTVGGVSEGKGKIQLINDDYRVVSPTDWFSSNDTFDYVYPVYFTNGQAEINVEISDDADFDIKDAWIQIRNTTTYATPYATWSRPMLKGSPKSKEYNNLISEKISSLISEYGIDAIHLDAAGFYGADGFKDTIMSITSALPRGTLIQCEFMSTWEEMDFWMYCFTHQPDMLANQFPGICVREHGSAAMLEGVREYSSWMDKTSPICDFVRDYVYYWSPGNSFVPTYKVTDICNKQPRKLPYRDSETRLLFRNAKRMRQISSLRHNYREYGLDENMLNEIRGLFSGSK